MSTTDGFACNLAALDVEQRTRHRNLTTDIAVHSVCVEETADGWRLLFRADNDLALLPSVAEWIALERRCCPFLHFRVVVTPTALWLELGGPAGVKSFLASEFPSLATAARRGTGTR